MIDNLLEDLLKNIRMETKLQSLYIMILKTLIKRKQMCFIQGHFGMMKR